MLLLLIPIRSVAAGPLDARNDHDPREVDGPRSTPFSAGAELPRSSPFSPATIIAEDAGEEIVKTFLEMAGQMGFHYEKDTPDIRRITADGVEFSNGKSMEAELKIIFPNWEPHPFIKALPIVDEAGQLAC